MASVGIFTEYPDFSLQDSTEFLYFLQSKMFHIGWKFWKYSATIRSQQRRFCRFRQSLAHFFRP